jgi:hypothetical protein
LGLRVKTGTTAQPLGGLPAYGCRLDGKALACTEHGPPEVDNEFVAWGWHKCAGQVLAAGVHEVQIEAKAAYAVVVDRLRWVDK